MTMTDGFDLTADTVLQGTVSRIGRWVRGTCARCSADDALLYDDYDDPTLLCSDCSHRRAAAKGKREELCDECGASPAWRDPLTRANEFFCAACHGRHGTVFQNRWATAARESKPLRNVALECAARGYGTDCKGELKWRSAFNKTLCNFHAGKKGAGPNG